MPFEVPPLPVASTSNYSRQGPATLLSLAGLSRPAYKGAQTHLESGQLGPIAGYENAVLQTEAFKEQYRRRQAGKATAQRRLGKALDKGKGKGRMIDQDEMDEDGEETNEKTDAAQDKEDATMDDGEDGNETGWRTEDPVIRPRGRGRPKRSERNGDEHHNRKVQFAGNMEFLADPHLRASLLPSSSLLSSIVDYTTEIYSRQTSTPFRFPPRHLTHSKSTTTKLSSSRKKPRPRIKTEPGTSTPTLPSSQKRTFPDPPAAEETEQKPQNIWKELDGDTLIALGVLMEEHIKCLIESSGYIPPPRQPSPPPPPSPRSSHPASDDASSALAPPATQQTVTFDPSSQPRPPRRSRRVAESTPVNMKERGSGIEETEEEEEDEEEEAFVPAEPTRIERPQTSAERRAAKKEEDRRERRKRGRGAGAGLSGVGDGGDGGRRNKKGKGNVARG